MIYITCVIDGCILLGDDARRELLVEFVDIQLVPYELLFGVDKPHCTLDEVRFTTYYPYILCICILIYTRMYLGGSSLGLVQAAAQVGRDEVLQLLSATLACSPATVC